MYGQKFNQMTGRPKKTKINKINNNKIAITLQEMFSMMISTQCQLKKLKKIKTIDNDAFI